MTFRRRAALVALGVCAALVVPAVAYGKFRGTDVLQGLAPSGGWGGGPLLHKFPLGAYRLDHHVDVGIAPGESWFQSVEQGMAAFIWKIVVFLDVLTIQLLTWAFSLDLVHAVLKPIAQASQNLYAHIGRFWMGAAVAGLGIWAAVKGLHQQRHGDAIRGIGMTVAFVLVAWMLMFSTDTTVGQLSDITHETVIGTLGTLHPGGGSPASALAGSLFREQVQVPWSVAEFGGPGHCVSATQKDSDGFPVVVYPPFGGPHICRDDWHRNAQGLGGYAPRFLAADDDTRARLYEAIKNGQLPGPPSPASTTPTQHCRLHPAACGPGGATTTPVPDPLAGFKVDKADAPAVDLMQAGGADQRLGLVLVVAFGSVMADRVFAALAVGMILSSVFALGLFSLGGVMIIAGMIPGRGHAAFKAWLGAGLVALLISAVYAVALVVLVTVTDALTPQTTTLGWIGVFTLRGLLFYLAFKFRHVIMGWLSARSHHEGMRTVIRRVEHPHRTISAAVSRARRASPARVPGSSVTRRRNPLPDAKNVASSAGGGRTRQVPADSSSPPASAGRTYSPNLNGHALAHGPNGSIPASSPNGNGGPPMARRHPSDPIPVPGKPHVSSRPNGNGKPPDRLPPKPKVAPRPPARRL